VCFVLLSWQVRKDFPLIIVANRDEFFGRATRSLHAWDDPAGIIAGRDLQAGGSWFGFNRSGRFAIVTNVRSGSNDDSALRSRGELITAFLQSELDIDTFSARLANTRRNYRPFNLLIGDTDNVLYVSSHQSDAKILDSGIYGLSNAELDTPWPKVTDGKKQFAKLLKSSDIDTEDFFKLLRDRHVYDDDELPETGVGKNFERQLSARFIDGESYGTRSSSVAICSAAGEVTVQERNHRGVLDGAQNPVISWFL
jgi:uncharacterized protein with NRDE domain